MQIDLLDQTNTLNTDLLHLLSKLVVFIGKKEQIPTQAEVSISFVEKSEIKRLNGTYRNLEEVIDVLSFEIDTFSQEELLVKNSNQPLILGDIIICVDVAREQAGKYNHSFERELGFLIVHGFLHLLAYDHRNKEEEQVMFQ